jgi:acyl dehydratase
MSHQSLLTPEVAAFLHRRASYVAPEPIGRPAFRYFAIAIGDENPVYVDDEAARAAGYEGVVAPPTLVCETNQYMTRERDPDGYMGHRFDIPVANCRQLRGGNEYEFFQPVRPDDVLHVEWEVDDIVERRSSTGVPMLVVRSVATYRNQHGELLVRNTETVIYQSLGGDDDT